MMYWPEENQGIPLEEMQEQSPSSLRTGRNVQILEAGAATGLSGGQKQRVGYRRDW